MAISRDALRLLAVSALILLSVGCLTDLSRRNAAAPSPMQAPHRRNFEEEGALPVADLRIAEPPGQAASTTKAIDAGASSVVKQAVSEEPKPALSQAIADSEGPSLSPMSTDAAPAASSLEKLESLYRAASQRYEQIDSYIVRLRRREQINGRDNPEEVMLVKFRKQPWSFYFKWLGKEAAGREVIYVKGRHEDKIHTLLASGDVPLMPAGKRLSLSPDNVLARSSSRHSIHEAGIGVLVEKFGGQLQKESKNHGHQPLLKYSGTVKRPEFQTPCEMVVQTIRPTEERLLPRGGTRYWYFDPATSFPVLIIALNEAGHEVEYYCYDRFFFPVRLDDDDFNPDKLWSPKKTPGKLSDQVSRGAKSLTP